MFKKPLRELKTSAPLKTSERKKLRRAVLEHYNIPTSDEGNGIGDLLVPEGLLSAKFSTHADEHGVLYLDGHDPLWFSVGKGSSELIPTVYTIWKYPTLLPILTTPKAVVPKLANGADLMAPGVVTCPHSLVQNQLVSIREYGTPTAPVAIGAMAINSNDLNDDTKGKAVYVYHVARDELWGMGSKTGPTDMPVVADGLEEAVDQLSLNDKPPDDKPASASEDDKNELTPSEVSSILRTSLLQALASLSPSSLPVSSSTLYSAHILPSRPSFNPTNTPIDIKHSSHKSLTHFLKAAQADGLLKLKEQKSDAMILSVDKEHPEVIAQAVAPHKTMADAAQKEAKKEAKAKEETGKTKEVIPVEMWKGVGNPKLTSLFKEVGKNPSDFYTAQDVRTLLNTYITAHSLPNPTNQSLIRLDPLLNSLLVASNENVDNMKREEMVKRLCGKMQSWYAISQGEDGEKVVGKGMLSPIHITTKQRQGRKIVTCITHFEPFFIDPASLSDELRLKCASSTSVSDLPGKLTHGQEVMVQGNHVSLVAETLLARGVPKKWIEVSDAAGKKK